MKIGPWVARKRKAFWEVRFAASSFATPTPIIIIRIIIIIIRIIIRIIRIRGRGCTGKL